VCPWKTKKIKESTIQIRNGLANANGLEITTDKSVVKTFINKTMKSLLLEWSFSIIMVFVQLFTFIHGMSRAQKGRVKHGRENENKARERKAKQNKTKQSKAKQSKGSQNNSKQMNWHNVKKG
jgi:hypothetical protein